MAANSGTAEATLESDAAIKANLLEYFQYIGRSDRVEFYDNPEMTRLFTGIPHPFMNEPVLPYSVVVSMLLEINVSPSAIIG